MIMMEIIDKVALIYLKNKQVLSTRSKGKDVYYLPGGKREEQETDQETLIREIKEELTVEIVKPSIKFYGIFQAQAHGKKVGVVVQMRCYTAQFTGKLRANSEIDEITWLSFGDRELVSPVDKLIFDDLHAKKFLS
jgi:8-oxo-dGTP pyrophosphatase MutT (NUDIX family)